ncbi:MAG TPA: LysM peptidoglycan-binding domain-containing protein [Chroococcales cyanobacterium]
MKHEISQELDLLAMWAENRSTARVPRRHFRILWSDDLARAALQAMGIAPPKPSPLPAMALPVALLATMSIPSEASAFSQKVHPPLTVEISNPVTSFTQEESRFLESAKATVSPENIQPVVGTENKLFEENQKASQPVIEREYKAPQNAPKAGEKKGKPASPDKKTKTFSHSFSPNAKGTAFQTVNYTVKRGESLYTIAARLMGNPNRWSEIYRLNKVKMDNPRQIFAGTKLILPATGIAPASNERPRKYRVARGDTLWTIAKSKLGSGFAWKSLYRHNQSRISNPKFIVPGQELQLPLRGEPNFFR